MSVIRLPGSGTTPEPGGILLKGYFRGAMPTAGRTPHLGALYLFALLRTGDCATAHAAVRFAVAAVVNKPTTMDASPSELWEVFAETIQNYGGWNDGAGGAASALERAALSDDQRATMALIGSGLSLRDVAAVLGIGVGTAKRSFNAGVRSLGDALRELGLTEPPERTRTVAESKACHPARHLRLVHPTPTEPRPGSGARPALATVRSLAMSRQPPPAFGVDEEV